jgi:hypothetical protein
MWCRSCRRAYDREYYLRNKPKITAQKRRRERELTAWARTLKSATPCADCGGVFHPAAMQWDHLPGADKRDEVADLARQHGRVAILAEIEKCELVCANCHAVRTYNRRDGT